MAKNGPTEKTERRILTASSDEDDSLDEQLMDNWLEDHLDDDESTTTSNGSMMRVPLENFNAWKRHQHALEKQQQKQQQAPPHRVGQASRFAQGNSSSQFAQGNSAFGQINTAATAVATSSTPPSMVATKRGTKPRKVGKSSYTNDVDYEKKKQNKHHYHVKVGPPGVVVNSIYPVDDVGSITEKAMADMSSDEMLMYLANKNRKMGMLEKIASNVTGAFDSMNTMLFASPGEEPAVMASKDPPVATKLFSSVRDALTRHVPLEQIAAAGITAKDLKREGLGVETLQTEFGLSLHDVMSKLRIPWSEICRTLGMRRDLLVRDPLWFDTRLLALDNIDLVRDLSFSIDDIFRIHCLDFEMSKLGFTMDKLLAMGLTRKEFLSLPWYPQSMITLLGLRKEHLEQLKLHNKHYLFLIQTRKWNPDVLVDELGFELEFVHGIITRAIRDHEKHLRNNNECGTSAAAVPLETSKSEEYAAVVDDCDNSGGEHDGRWERKGGTSSVTGTMANGITGTMASSITSAMASGITGDMASSGVLTGDETTPVITRSLRFV